MLAGGMAIHMMHILYGEPARRKRGVRLSMAAHESGCWVGITCSSDHGGSSDRGGEGDRGSSDRGGEGNRDGDRGDDTSECPFAHYLSRGLLAKALPVRMLHSC